MFWQCRSFNPVFLLPWTHLTTEQKGRGDGGGGKEMPYRLSSSSKTAMRKARKNREKVVIFLHSNQRQTVAAPRSRRGWASRKEEPCNSSAERSRVRFQPGPPSADTHMCSKRHTHTRTCTLAALIHQQTTHPDTWNPLILSISLPSIQNRESNRECVCLHGWVRAGKKWRVHGCMHRWEMSAVWDCLCNKPIKSRMGGRVKQPAVYYGREKERDREAESGRHRTTFVWIFFFASYSPDFPLSLLILLCRYPPDLGQ